jgi:hypothetical protein
MKSKSGILFFFSLCFLSPPVSLGAPGGEPVEPEPNAPSIRVLHVFVRADVNQVFFENIWVFQRQSPAHTCQISINLPDGAVLSGLDEPNQTRFVAETGVINKSMTAGSLFCSVGFSFVLPNQAGDCQTQIVPAYKVDSMVVSVSGSATEILSNVLKSHELEQSYSGFSSVYTASNLPAGAKVQINLKHLPCKGWKLLKVACVAGLGLIVIAALLTLYWNQKTIKNRNSDNEVCFEQYNSS